MQDFFSKNKLLIEQFLRDFFAHKQTELAKVNAWGTDVTQRYSTFTFGGKMIRGCLTILGYEMFGKKASPEIIKTAAAMEIFQSALLIHDDIMDRDTTRRDMDTINTQYQKYGEQQNVLDSQHFGQSMGVCVGDIGFFLAFELLAEIPKIHSMVAKELINVGIAQMQDVHFGQTSVVPSQADILNLYRYKTARYTFSLPLVTGAMLAGQPKKTIKILETLGEHLGIMFQLKDDELDAEGDQREGKKTLLWLDGGNKTKVDRRIASLAKDAERLVSKLPVDPRYARILLELLEYNKKRTQ